MARTTAPLRPRRSFCSGLGLWAALLATAAPAGASPTAAPEPAPRAGALVAPAPAPEVRPARAAASTSEPKHAEARRALWQALLRALRQDPAGAVGAPLQQLLAAQIFSGWPGAWSLGEALALEAGAHDGAVALALARAGAALAPQRPLALRALAWAQWRGGERGAAVWTWRQALLPLEGPGARALQARLALFAMLAMATALALSAAAAMMQALPRLAHDVGHRLPAAFGLPARWAVGLLAAMALAGLGLGPIPTSVVVLALALPYSNVPQRRSAAVVLALMATALLALPLTLEPLLQLASPAGARAYAVRDATASWARARLPDVAEAAGLDAWAHGLVAHFEGDEAAAAAALTRAAATLGAPRLAVARGNVAYAQGDYAAARAHYEAALKTEPMLAIAQFNRSQALLALIDPSAAQRAREQAFAAGGAPLVAAAAAAQAAGRAVLEGPPPPELERAAADEAAFGAPLAAQRAMFRPLGGEVPRVTAIMLLLALALVTTARLGGLQLPGATRRLARRCSRCGTISCPVCAPDGEALSLCGACQRAALGTDEASRALRDVQEQRSAQYFAGRLALQRLGAYAVPGLGLMLGGRPMLGVVLHASWFALLLLLLHSLDVLPAVLPLWGAPGATLGSLGPAVLAALTLAVAAASLVLGRGEQD